MNWTLPAGIAVRERNVGRLPRRHGNRHADDRRPHWIEAARLEIERYDTGSVDALEPARKRSLIDDRFVMMLECKPRRLGGRHRRTRAQGKLARLEVQARAFPYSASKRLHAFSACGWL